MKDLKELQIIITLCSIFFLSPGLPHVDMISWSQPLDLVSFGGNLKPPAFQP